jgi:hypothetical protein
MARSLPSASEEAEISSTVGILKNKQKTKAFYRTTQSETN